MATSLTDLRTDVRQLSNEPNTNGLVSDTILTNFINQAQRAVWHDLLQQDENYIVSQQDITLVSGTELYTPGSDFVRVIDIQRIDGDVVYSLEEVPLQDRDLYLPENAALQLLRFPRTLFFYFQGSQIGVLPPPQEAGTLRMYYIPVLTALSAGGDNMQLNDEFRSWVVAEAAWRVSIYVREPRADIQALRNEEKQRYSTLGDQRSVGKSRHVRYTGNG